MGFASTLSYRFTKRYNQFKNHYDRFVDKNAVPTYSTIDVGFVNTFNSAKYYCGCTYGDKVYFFPLNETRILVIDSTDDSFYFVGNIAGTGKFASAVLAPNGFIYATGSYGSVLKFNPKDDSFTSFGSSFAGYTHGVLIGTDIYYLTSNTTLEFKVLDTITDTFRTVSLTGGIDNSLTFNPVLGINGDIYFQRGVASTLGTDRLGRINMKTFEVTYKDIPSTNTTLYPWGSNPTVHPNGKIYWCQYVTNKWCIVDTLNNDDISFSNIPTPADDTRNKHYACTLGPNGKIYTVPYSDDFRIEYEELDPDTDITAKILDADLIFPNSIRHFFNLQLCPNGNMYAAPFDISPILKISFNNTKEFNKEFTQSTWYNSGR